MFIFTEVTFYKIHILIIMFCIYHNLVKETKHYRTMEHTKERLWMGQNYVWLFGKCFIKQNLAKKQNYWSPQIPFYAGVSKAARYYCKLTTVDCQFFESDVKKEEIQNCASLLNSALKKLKKNASLERISTNCAQKRWEQLSYRT